LARLDVTPNGEVPLVISLDGNHAAVADVAAEFQWQHGPKIVKQHGTALGLRDHILACGSLSSEYGAVIVLEDDLVCARSMYSYVEAALEFHGEQSSKYLAGYALYAPRFLENRRLHFYPATGGYDTYWVHYACSWGQVWTNTQWREFLQWYERSHASGVHPGANIPDYVARWPESSWKKYFQRYLAETKLYVAYPARSLTSNHAELGMHMREPTTQYLTVLDERTHWQFAPAAKVWLYDAWFEPKPESLRRLWSFLPDDLEVDLHGGKPLAAVRAKHLLSPRTCRDKIQSFPFARLPLPYNLDESGEGLNLGATRSFEETVPRGAIAELLNGPVHPRIAVESLRRRASAAIRRRLRRGEG
jgi:hypothetical protein